MTISEIKVKWQKRYSELVLRGIESWEDLGFDKPPKNYISIEEWMIENEEYDESEQTEIEMIKQFLDDLRQVK